MVRLNRFLGVFRKHSEAKTSQLLETIGSQEIAKVWDRYGLKHRKSDNLLAARFFNGVNRRGGKFAYHHRHLPALCPELGMTMTGCGVAS